jgi:hypothetical protein
MGKRLVYNWEKTPNKKFTIGEKTHKKKIKSLLQKKTKNGNVIRETSNMSIKAIL